MAITEPLAYGYDQKKGMCTCGDDNTGAERHLPSRPQDWKIEALIWELLPKSGGEQICHLSVQNLDDPFAYFKKNRPLSPYHMTLANKMVNHDIPSGRKNLMICSMG